MCGLSSWLFNVCMDRAMINVKMGLGRVISEILSGWGRMETVWPLGFLNTNEPFLCDESEQSLRA